jgi:hypothetical protein
MIPMGMTWYPATRYITNVVLVEGELCLVIPMVGVWVVLTTGLVGA